MFLSWFLLGIINVQVCASRWLSLEPPVAESASVDIFYLNQPHHNNPLREIKWFGRCPCRRRVSLTKGMFEVYGLFLLEWAQTIMMTHDAFHWYVINWGNSATLNDISLIWLSASLHILRILQH